MTTSAFIPQQPTYDPDFQDPWADADPDGSPAIPHESCDLDAERQVIGAMLTTPAIVPQVAAEVSAGDFYTTKLGEIAQIIFQFDRDGAPIDTLSVARELRARGLERKIPADFIFSLTTNVVLASTAPAHARAIRQHARLREVGIIGQQLTGLSRSTHLDDIPEALARAQQQLDALHNANPAAIPPALPEALPTHLDRLETRKQSATVNTASSGLTDLDTQFRGLRPGRFTIVAGRPGTGKSLLGLCIARATAIRMHNPTLLASMEMPVEEVLDRLLAAEARVELGHIADGELTDPDWQRIAKTLPRLIDAPLHIDDSEHVTLDGLRNTVRTMRRGPGCELVIVDYLQLMEAPRAQNREQSVAAVSRGLKLMAREFNIPIVALCQLNRESEKRTDKRPTKSDLRESGSLEQDADNVILLHRPELYGEEDRAGEIDVIVDKHRGGHLFTVKSAFLGHYGSIANMANHHDWSPSRAAA